MQYPYLVDFYVARILEGRVTMELVPAIIKEDVERMINEDLQIVIDTYVMRVMNGQVDIDNVPVAIREEVRAETGKSDNFVLIYVAQIIDGKIKLEDVPENVREEAELELERLVGKKDL